MSPKKTLCHQRGTLSYSIKKGFSYFAISSVYGKLRPFNNLSINFSCNHSEQISTMRAVSKVCPKLNIFYISRNYEHFQVHPCGRYRHNTVVFILAKEYQLKNLRTIHRLDRLTSGLLMFGRNPKKARDMEQQIRNRQVIKEYVCRVEGEFPE